MNADNKPKWSFTIATIGGTQVRIHFTFLILLAWVALAFGRVGGATAALSGLAFFGALFLCVLLHEFGHVTAARFFGIKTPTITLLPIGGLAMLEKIPKNPRSEIIIALAGPMVNVVIVASLWSVAKVAPNFDPQLPLDPEESVPMLQRIMWINVILACFNLIPALPMDGGRVFRALLAFKMPWALATRVAAFVGQILAVTGGFVGLLAGNPFLVIIAVFIFLAAGAEANAAEQESLLSGISASEVAISMFESLRPDTTVGEAAKRLMAGSQHDFPVIDEKGVCVGVLTRVHLIHALSDLGERALVSAAMETDFPTLELETPAIEALRSLTERRLSAAPVVNTGGKLNKWLTVDDIAEVLMTRAALAKP